MGNVADELKRHLSKLGKKGGEARARKLTKAQRKEIAKAGAVARWKKPRP